MKEQILSTFAAMGFQLEKMENFGYSFHYEGISYLYIPNDDDEDFLDIAIPAVVEITEDNRQEAFMLMNELNSTLMYVKAYKHGDSIWLFYERELLGGEDIEKLLSRMILHLENGLDFFHKAMDNSKEESDKSNDDTPTNETDETT